jgi:hypothetical protein
MSRRSRKGPFQSFQNRPARASERPQRSQQQREVGGQVQPSGLGGQKQEMIAVPVNAKGEQVGGIAGPKGGPGIYEVTLLLQKPGYPLFREREFRFGMNAGDSHIILGTQTTIKIDVKYSRGTAQFFGVPNQRGALGAIRIMVQADDFKVAKEHAYRVIAPTLSIWSTALDMPVEISRIELVEQSTSARQMSIVNPYLDAALVTATERIGSSASQDLRVFLSYYREALISNSDPYQLLCLFKIIEGIRARRIRTARQAKRDGAEVPAVAHDDETIPGRSEQFVPWLERIFLFRTQPWDELAIDSIFIPEVRGQSFEDLVKPGDRATKSAPGSLCALRDEVAHSIGPASGGGAGLLADESLHVVRVGNWLPIAKCVVRFMLMNEFPGELWNRTPNPQDSTEIDQVETTP